MDEKQIYKILQEKSRDNARTPMQWDDSVNGGFSDVEPWLQPNENYHEINVKNSLQDEDSIFKYYQKLIKLRKEYKIISEGKYFPLLEEHPQIFAYKRILDDQELIVLNNFYDQEIMLDLNLNGYQILINNYNDSCKSCLKPYQSIVLYKTTSW